MNKNVKILFNVGVNGQSKLQGSFLSLFPKVRSDIFQNITSFEYKVIIGIFQWQYLASKN